MRNIPRATTSQSYRNGTIVQIQQDSESKASKRYMKLYFLKTNYKTILQNNFNNKLKALPPGDHRRPAVLAIVQDKFRELYLEEVNLLICQHQISEKFYVYFSDAEWIPISKCCNAQVYLLLNSSSQKTDIFCCTCSRNLQNPPKSAISSASFLPKTAFAKMGHSVQEQKERQKVSRMIVSGKFRKVNLRQVYNEVEQQQNVNDTLEFEPKFMSQDKQLESTILELKDLINELY